HRATALRLLGGLLEPGLVEARHPPPYLELHLGDLGRPVDHVHGARRRGLDPGDGLPGLLEPGRQRHAETGGARRRDELFGVRALLSLEPGGTRVRAAERAAPGLEVPLPALEPAFPERHRLTPG